MRLRFAAPLAIALVLSGAASASAASHVQLFDWGTQLVMREGCTPDASRCSPGWLEPTTPSFDLRATSGYAWTGTDAYFDPLDPQSAPLRIASGAYDVDGDGTFEAPATVAQSLGAGYSDPFYRGTNTFTLGANAAVPPSLAPTLTVRAQATAADGTTAQTDPIALYPPARRVRIAWDNDAKIDLHIWKPGADGTDRFADHAYYGAPWGVPGGTIVSTQDGATTGLQIGSGPYAYVDYPQLNGSNGTFSRPDGYTVGVCQYDGSNATVTATITEADGTSRVLTQHLGPAKSAWLVATTGGVRPVIQNGWCNGNEPTVVGGVSEPVPVVQIPPALTPSPTPTASPPAVRLPVAAPAVPTGTIATATIKRGKKVTLAFAHLPKRAVVNVSWTRRGARPKSASVRVANGKTVAVRAPKTHGRYTVTVTYTNLTLLKKTVAVAR